MLPSTTMGVAQHLKFLGQVCGKRTRRDIYAPAGAPWLAYWGKALFKGGAACHHCAGTTQRFDLQGTSDAHDKEAWVCGTNAGTSIKLGQRPSSQRRWALDDSYLCQTVNPQGAAAHIRCCLVVRP